MKDVRDDPFRDATGLSRESIESARQVVSRFLRLAPHAPDGLVTRASGWRPRRPLLVGDLLPAGYDAACRIFHPLQGEGPSQTLRMVRWKGLLGNNDLVSLRHLQLEQALSHLKDKVAGTRLEPLIGDYDRETARLIANAIAEVDGPDAEAHFMFWSGIGTLGLSRDAVYLGKVRAVDGFLLLTPRHHHLYQSPSVWLSVENKWCVATFTDSASTYVGGPRSLIQRLLKDETLDALIAAPEDAADDVNAVP